MGFWAIIGIVAFIFLCIIYMAIKGLATIAIHILGILCILLLIKNLIQDIGFGLIKWRRNIILGLISIINNIIRIIVFYKLIFSTVEALNNTQDGLLDSVAWVILFVVNFFIGGIFFIMGEFVATSFALEDGIEDLIDEISVAESSVLVGIIINILMTVFLVILYKWQF